MTQRKKAKAKKPATPKKPKISKLARDVDALLALKKAIELITLKAAPLKKRFDALEEQILERYDKDELQSVKTKRGLVSRTESVVPTVKDFEALWAYAKEKNAPELFRKQVNTDAWREHLDHGEQVPGVEAFTRVGLQVRLGKK